MLKICIEAAIKAGEEILKVYNSDDFGVETKDNDSPLTKADLKSHNTIISYLEKTDYPILSEEGKELPYETRKTWETYWLIDPLDGTKEFIKRNGEFTVNIALISNGVPVLGVVYVPVTDTLYYAEENKGAYLIENAKNNNEAKKIEAIDIVDNKIIAVASKSHLNEETEAYMTNLEKKGFDVEKSSRGSSLKLCMVAHGKAHVYPRFGPTMEWDTGAAHAVCREAGAEVIDVVTGRELQYNKENLLNNYFIVQSKKVAGIIND